MALDQDQLSPVWDQISIDTPELVEIEMPVAGIGSRFVALLIDYLIWFVVVVVVGVLDSMIDPSLARFSKLGEKWEIALVTLFFFLLFWGYFALFEAFWNGRTPGKRIAKIRVIQRTGRGIGIYEALIRNLLRVIDMIPPPVYAVGVICIFVTRQNQRLGDLAAGTIVVHERDRLVSTATEVSGRTFTSGLFTVPAAVEIRPRIEVASAAVQRLGPADLEVLEGFFARRLDFTLETRAALAQRILAAILNKSGLVLPPDISPEIFLEEIARQLRDLSRLG